MQHSSVPEQATTAERVVSPVETNSVHISREEALHQYIPEALYWEKYYDLGDVRYEWNNGQLEIVPMTDYAKYMMYLWLLDALRDFLHVHPIAKIIGLDLGFRLALPTKTTIRKPDLGLVLDSNPVPLSDHDRSYRGTFDLCIESLSDSQQSEIDRDTIIKRDEYAAAGVQEYYILDERGIETQFYCLVDGSYAPLPRPDGIVHSRVLPGFQFRVQDLYDKPSPQQMVDDPVYRAYISPLYRTERQRADWAEERVERERQRADHYAALLKEAGLLPPE